MKRVCWFLISLMLLSASGDPAFAQSTPTTPGTDAGQQPVFGIQTNPYTEANYFSVKLNPGESASLTASVVTVNSMPLALTAYVTNALSVANGGFGAGTQTDTLRAPASWIEFAPTSFKLGSNDTIDLPFTVTVPADATPGEYVAALIAQTDGPIAIHGSGALNQVIRSAIPVLVTVPGTLTARFTLQAPGVTVTGGQATLVIPVANTGNVRVRPAGDLAIADADGTSIGTLPIAMGTVFPGTETTIEVPLPAQMAPGTYVVSGTLTDPESKVAAEIPATTITVAAVPTPTATPAPITLDPASITAVGNPIQFANVSLTINNTGGTIPTGRVTLKVSRDGKSVESYVLAQNQAMPYGTSTIEARYIPASGWQSGVYSFEVQIEAVGADGIATVMVDMPLKETITIP